MKKLYIQQKIFKITDHYPVTDINGEIVYMVDEDFKLIGFSVNISSVDGEILCHISRKVFAWLTTFYLNFSSGLEVTMKSRFTFLKKKIDIDPENLNIYIEGNIFHHHYEVYKDGLLIGRINKEFFTFRDKFELEIIDEQYELLFVAIVIAVDHIIDSDRRSASTNNSN